MNVTNIPPASNAIYKQNTFKNQAPYLSFLFLMTISSIGFFIANYTIKKHIPLFKTYLSKFCTISTALSLIGNLAVLSLIGPLFIQTKTLPKNHKELLNFAKLLENYKEEIGIFDPVLKTQIEKISLHLKNKTNIIDYQNSLKNLQKIKNYLKRCTYDPDIIIEKTPKTMIEDFLYENNKALEILFKEVWAKKRMKGYFLPSTSKKMQEWFNHPDNRPFLETIEELNLSRYNLKFIPKEIEKLSYLKHLNLRKNPIVDFRSLEKLQRLEELIISDVTIYNTSFLRNLKNIHYLEISCSKIKNLHFLKDLQKIYQLNLQNSKVTDKTGIENRKKYSIVYEQNEIYYFWSLK